MPTPPTPPPSMLPASTPQLVGTVVLTAQGRRARVQHSLADGPTPPAGTVTEARLEALDGVSAGAAIRVPLDYPVWPCDPAGWVVPPAATAVDTKGVAWWVQSYLTRTVLPRSPKGAAWVPPTEPFPGAGCYGDEAGSEAGGDSGGPLAAVAVEVQQPLPGLVAPAEASHRADRAPKARKIKGTGMKAREGMEVGTNGSQAATATGAMDLAPSSSPSLFVQAVTHSVKGPLRSYTLAPLSLVVGPNGAGKTSLVNAIELAASVGASDLQGRSAVLADHLLAALGARQGRIGADLTLSDGTTLTWSLGKDADEVGGKRRRKGPGQDVAGTGTKAQSVGRATTEASRPVRVAFPLRDVLEALRGKPETAAAFLVAHVGADAVPLAGLRGSLSPAALAVLRTTFDPVEDGPPTELPSTLPVTALQALAARLLDTAKAAAGSAAAAKARVQTLAATLQAAPDDPSAVEAHGAAVVEVQRLTAARDQAKAALDKALDQLQAVRTPSRLAAAQARLDSATEAEARLVAASQAAKAQREAAAAAAGRTAEARDRAEAALQAAHAACHAAVDPRNEKRRKVLAVLEVQGDAPKCLVCEGPVEATALVARRERIQRNLDQASEQEELVAAELRRAEATAAAARRADEAAQAAGGLAVERHSAARQQALDARTRLAEVQAAFDQAQAADGAGDTVESVDLDALRAAASSSQTTLDRAVAGLAGTAARKAAQTALATTRDQLQQARTALTASEERQKAAADAAEAIQATVKRVLDGAVVRFEQRVQGFLPASLQFGLQLRDGDKDVVRWGVRRVGPAGVPILHEGLCGAEWSQITVALALATVPQDCDLAVVVPEDRAWDAKTLGAFLRALRQGLGSYHGPPVQVLVTSTVLPPGKLDGWTVVAAAGTGDGDGAGDGDGDGDGDGENPSREAPIVPTMHEVAVEAIYDADAV